MRDTDTWSCMRTLRGTRRRSPGTESARIPSLRFHTSGTPRPPAPLRGAAGHRSPRIAPRRPPRTPRTTRRRCARAPSLSADAHDRRPARAGSRPPPMRPRRDPPRKTCLREGHPSASSARSPPIRRKRIRSIALRMSAASARPPRTAGFSSSPARGCRDSQQRA